MNNPTPQHKEEWEETIENCFLTERMTDWPVPTVRVNPDTLKHIVRTLRAEAKQEGREEAVAFIISKDPDGFFPRGLLEAAKSN